MEVIAQVRYDRYGEIGAGSGQNSRVYEAYDHHLHADLVVKEIEKARIGDPTRYFLEAKAVHASAHPRVVPIYWAGESGDHVCLAMPNMKGGSLAGRIAKGPLRTSNLIRVAQDVCEGIAQVHIAKFVHLDVKPTNVLFDSNGRCAVSDFGQAMPLDYAGTADARDICLYPSFMPPEFILHKGVVTNASDVYQIGLTLYRAANGEPYFQEQWKAISARQWPGAHTAIATGEFPSRDFLPCVPRGIQQAILRALEVDPAKRPVGARALAEEIGRVTIAHEWITEEYLPDTATWRLQIAGKADVLIHRRGLLPSARVEIWTEASSGLRRKSAASWTKLVRTPRQLKMALGRAFRAATK